MLTWRSGITSLFLMGLPAVSFAGELQIRLNDAEGNPRAGAVIELIAPAVPLPPDWPMTGIMDQINKEFVGPVLTVVAGSTVSFPNSDDVHHHVYSFSPAKRFELPLYTGNTAAPVLFETPGVVTIGCNIHDWMVGYIYVGESHLMAVTNSDGVGVISNVPAGTYAARVWHSGLMPGQDAPTFDVTVAEQGVTAHTVSAAAPPAQSLRRAPLPGMRQY